MPNYERQVELAVPPQEATNMLLAALGALPKASPPRVDGAWVTTNIGVSGMSWGENVAGFVQPGPGRCMITVRSKSVFGLVDWGKNKKNVEATLARLHGPPPPGR